MSELVTGEAVALELRPAKLPSRALAVLLDLVVAFLAYILVTTLVVMATASLDEAARTALSIACFLLVLVGGPMAVETLSHGRSLGKLVFGLRVVRDDGGPIRFRHALVRGAVGMVEILMTLGVIACIASLVSARGRRLGDVFAGTLVVRERVPSGRVPFVPPPPPWLSGRFGELDLSAVPDGLWLAVRQYLTRMRQLDPAVGQAMADRLAADVAARTGAPLPPGVPAAAYLAAVVQERQAREFRRASGAGSPAGAGAGAYAEPSGQGQGPYGPSPYGPSPYGQGSAGAAGPVAYGAPGAPVPPGGPAVPAVPPVAQLRPADAGSPGPSSPSSAALSSDAPSGTGFAPPA